MSLVAYPTPCKINDLLVFTFSSSLIIAVAGTCGTFLSGSAQGGPELNPRGPLFPHMKTVCCFSQQRQHRALPVCFLPNADSSRAKPTADGGMGARNVWLDMSGYKLI